MGSCKLIGPGVLGVTMVQYISAGNVRPFSYLEGTTRVQDIHWRVGPVFVMSI